MYICTNTAHIYGTHTHTTSPHMNLRILFYIYCTITPLLFTPIYSLQYSNVAPSSSAPLIRGVPGVSLQKHLTHEQMLILRTYLQDSSITTSMRDKVRIILFSRYKPFVYSTTRKFIQKHKHKCTNINRKELYLYGFIGLFHAIRKYNASYTFYPFVQQYVHGYLLQCLTHLHPISTLSSTQRKRRQRRPFEETAIPREKNTYLGTRTYLPSNLYEPHLQHPIQRQQYKDTWQYIRTELSPFIQQIFFYKFDPYFHKIRSNYEVGQLIGCSEEYVRHCVSKNIIRIVYRNGESESTQSNITINAQ